MSDYRILRIEYTDSTNSQMKKMGLAAAVGEAVRLAVKSAEYLWKPMQRAMISE